MRYSWIFVVEGFEEDGVVVEGAASVVVAVIVVVVVVFVVIFLLETAFVFSFLLFPLNFCIEVYLTEIGFVVGRMEIAAVDEVGQQGLDIRFIVIYGGQLEELREEGFG